MHNSTANKNIASESHNIAFGCQNHMITTKKSNMDNRKSKKSKKSLDVAPVAPVADKEEAPVSPVFEEDVETPEERAYRNKETINTVLVLLFFSALMFSLPFAAFFGVRNYLMEHLHVFGFANTCWSVISAVLTANIIICGYVYIAYRDNQAEIQRNKQKSI